MSNFKTQNAKMISRQISNDSLASLILQIVRQFTQVKLHSSFELVSKQDKYGSVSFCLFKPFW